MHKKPMRTSMLIFLILLSGCNTEQISSPDEPDDIDEWIEYKIHDIFIKADNCIKSCPVIGNCVEQSCISGCSSNLDREIDDLKSALQENDIPDERIYNLVEYQTPFAPYLSCIQGCYGKCFETRCINGCEFKG